MAYVKKRFKSCKEGIAFGGKLIAFGKKDIAYDKKDNTLGKNGKVFGENDNAQLMKGMTLD